MKVSVPHHTTKENARRIVEQRLADLQRQYGNVAEDLDHSWTGDTLYVAAKARGFHLKGTIEVTDTEVIIDGKLPLMAMPFESRIRSTVEKEAESMFRTA